MDTLYTRRAAPVVARSGPSVPLLLSDCLEDTSDADEMHRKAEGASPDKPFVPPLVARRQRRASGASVLLRKPVSSCTRIVAGYRVLLLSPVVPFGIYLPYARRALEGAPLSLPTGLELPSPSAAAPLRVAFHCPIGSSRRPPPAL
ncbi:hypothetical protein HPB50_023264 [Hyalomma asiaticum]|uniref:Uncharacterized protein n=1 Tax=Hyalomma asiaticum TaxID=266040 RepID=A0ACB7S940_HYAAI|nr:hypothetical protein HPB50_023264 [Hyalomma asiaticum]